MLEYQARQQILVDRRIGYSLTNVSDHLDLEARRRSLEQRMQNLENS